MSISSRTKEEVPHHFCATSKLGQTRVCVTLMANSKRQDQIHDMDLTTQTLGLTSTRKM